ncbi:hypothetical protein JCM10207_004987 [Rhodosporidiobolus poonsookiae]
MSSSDSPAVQPHPASPPLIPTPFATRTPSSAAPSTPSTAHCTPLTDAATFTPRSTPSTAFTTPETSQSLDGWRPLKPVGSKAAAVPTGFEYLDGAFKSETGERESRSFEWQGYADASSLTGTPTVYKRHLGPTEVSYYLGSRGEGIEGGVNDMYLHLGLKTRSALLNPDRVLDVWTELVKRHTLLASRVEFEDYYDVQFVYEPPANPSEARNKAASLLDLRTGQDGKALLDAYLNGPRTLSDRRLAYLLVSTPEATFSSSDPTTEQEYDVFFFATHFIGDGMALHTTADEFFSLLTSESAFPLSPAPTALAPAMESKLLGSASWGKLGWAAGQVEFANDQAKLIGGHAFPRAKRGVRKTLVPTVSYDSDKTKRILATCKSRGSTISHAVFALCNVAFVRSVKEERRKPEMPVMIYSALNVRGFLKKDDADPYHIAIGYYNVILPSFIPSSLPASTYFWHQSASVRAQTSKAVKSPFLAARTALMALERERRSIGFEKADEEKRRKEVEDVADALLGLGISGAPAQSDEAKKAAETERVAREEALKAARTLAGTKEAKEEIRPAALPKAPSTALMGVSMLGNLDGIYKHASYQGVQLHTLTTGSRQRPGALLLFAYTFAGKLFLSLGYDSHGFEAGAIEAWWAELLKGVDELLLEEPSPEAQKA